MTDIEFLSSLFRNGGLMITILVIVICLALIVALVFSRRQRRERFILPSFRMMGSESRTERLIEYLKASKKKIGFVLILIVGALVLWTATRAGMFVGLTEIIKNLVVDVHFWIVSSIVSGAVIFALLFRWTGRHPVASISAAWTPRRRARARLIRAKLKRVLVTTREQGWGRLLFLSIFGIVLVGFTFLVDDYDAVPFIVKGTAFNVGAIALGFVIIVFWSFLIRDLNEVRKRTRKRKKKPKKKDEESLWTVLSFWTFRETDDDKTMPLITRHWRVCKAPLTKGRAANNRRALLFLAIAIATCIIAIANPGDPLLFRQVERLTEMKRAEDKPTQNLLSRGIFGTNERWARWNVENGFSDPPSPNPLVAIPGQAPTEPDLPKSWFWPNLAMLNLALALLYAAFSIREEVWDFGKGIVAAAKKRSKSKADKAEEKEEREFEFRKMQWAIYEKAMAKYDGKGKPPQPPATPQPTTAQPGLPHQPPQGATFFDYLKFEVLFEAIQAFIKSFISKRVEEKM